MIHVTDRDGVDHALEPLDGWRVMEIVRDWGLPVRGDCGGACSCATCHVYVAPEWVDRLPEPLDEELAMLDGCPDVEPNSRLACQLVYGPALSGLRITLAPEG